MAAHRRYIEELRDAVRQGTAEGRTLEQLQAGIAMDAYRDWGAYNEWRTENIAGMYAILTRSE